MDQAFSSLDAQREACAQYVLNRAHEGWVLLEQSYEDGGFTGANTNRPGFQRLLDDVDRGLIDIIVVYKVDRLSRSLMDFARFMERLNQNGCAFVSVTQNFSTADAMGRLTLNMLMSFAEFEREMISERTRDKIAASRRKGKWTGGPVPFGFRSVEGQLLPDDLEAPVAREVYDLYLEHRSALAVMQMLNQLDRPCRRRPKRGAHVRGMWSKQGVLRVLRNPVYCGRMPYKDEVHEGEHEGLIDERTWQLVQRLLDENAGQSASWGRNPDYLLRSILRCGICGSAMTPASTRRRGREYRYYRCVKREKEGRDACGAKPLPASEIEDYVLEQVRSWASDPYRAREVQAEAVAKLDAERERIRVLLNGLEGRLSRVRDALERQRAEALAVGEGSPLWARVEGLQAEENALVRERRAAEKDLVVVEEAKVEASWVSEVLEGFDAVWDVMTPENRCRLVRLLVESVEAVAADGRVVITLSDPSGRVTCEEDIDAERR